MKKYLAHPAIHNVFSLYALQWAGYFIPMLTLPYLARVLRPQGFGLLMFSQAYALWASLFIEYGFNLSATREIARARDDEAVLAHIVASVLGAKIALLGTIAVVSIVGILCVPVFREHPIYLLCTMPQILAGGFSPFWYFQGTEKMVRAITIEFFSRILFTGFTFLVVQNASDGWKALLLQACAGCSSTLFQTILMYSETSFVLPNWTQSKLALRDGWSTFLFRGSYSIFTTSNAFILGLLASPFQVGLYAGAERIARAMQGQIMPVAQTFYPRISHKFSQSPASAKRLARTVILVSGLSGIFLGLGLAIAATPLTHLLLGRGYEGSVPVVRLFALSLPINALNNGLIMNWMLPLRMDRKACWAIVAGIVVNVVAAILLAPRFAQEGMGLAVIVAGAFTLVIILAMLKRSDPVCGASLELNIQNTVDLV